MHRSQPFHWHPDARLFAADTRVPRPVDADPGPVHIRPGSPGDMLTLLAQALATGSSFAVTDDQPERLPDDGFITQTGGSTGAPKRIRRQSASWRASFDVNADRFDISPADRVAVLGGLAHSLALYGVLEALHLGADAHVLAGVSPARQARLLDSKCVTILYATPTQLRLLLTRSQTQPGVRLILCGGGALDEGTATALKTVFPNAQVHVFYGTAETSFITLARPDTPPGCVGHPYPGVTLRLRDQHGQATGGHGTIWVRSPYVALGYAGPDRPLPTCEDGFFATGEVGHLDADGRLWLQGRQDRLLTVSDVTISPEMAEAVILRLPGVTHCAVLPQVGGARGMSLVAVVDGQPDADLALQARAACRHALTAGLVPAEVVFHPDFPLLASGKPDLVTLASWLEDRA